MLVNMTAQLTTTRQERGQQIAKLEGQVSRVDDYIYTVKSQSGNGEYIVNKVNGQWMCECPDNTYRHLACKHIHAVNLSMTIRTEVKETVQALTIAEVNLEQCPHCQSKDIVKDGLRHNKSGDKQIYLCQTCKKFFTPNLGFKKMTVSPQTITSAMQLYFTGESLRNVQKFLKLQGIKISHVAIGKWINKYVKLMNEYLEKIKPNVSDVWRADEMYVKINGNMKYLFAMLDDETRFWIAQEVADTKDRHDTRNLLRMSKENMGKKPLVFITDGLPSYNDAYKKEFRTLGLPQTKHIRHITLRGDRNNNKMERFNGEVRDREKVLRGLKKDDSVLLSGYQLYHNYFRPHEALNGKTPSEACGITIEGQNKWKTLIQNASKNRKL